MKINNETSLLEEKYRPQTIDDMILPEAERQKFKSYIKDGKLPNLLLISNTPGIGKTTLTKIFVNELNKETKWINASKDNGVDVIRNSVEGFCSTGSYNTNGKLVIMDEADSLTVGTRTAPGSQEILRGTIESFNKSSRFILTANYEDRFIEPLVSRLTKFNFDDIFQKNKKEVAVQIFNRLKFILENEGISYEANDVKEIVKTHFPSIRNMTVAIERNTQDGKLIISDLGVATEFSELLSTVFGKDDNMKKFTNSRRIITDFTNPTSFYSWLWLNIDDTISKTSMDEKRQSYLFQELDKAQDNDSRASNKQITLMSFIVKLINMNIKAL